MLGKGVAIVAVLVVTALGLSVLIGLTAPDGQIGDESPAALTPPTASTSAEPPEPESTADLAPASVAGTWPGRPTATKVRSDDEVDWCPAVTAEPTTDAVREFGRDAVDAAACAAVSFVFDHRYSRLSLPRAAYARADFDEVLTALSRSTADVTYRSRVDQFVASPSDDGAKKLGLVLLRSAGDDHRFYGPRNSAQGYADRAVWINPRWSTVEVGLDRTRSTPRLTARLTAQASIPVFHVEAARDDMLTVPTAATFQMRREGDRWVIGGWTIDAGSQTFDPLAVL